MIATVLYILVAIVATGLAPADTLADAEAWERFIAWLVAGLLIYLVYGRVHSLLRRGEDAEAAPTTEGLL